MSNKRTTDFVWQLDISLFDFLYCRFQIERARRVVSIGVILLVGHFENGTVETVDKIVHFTRLAGIGLVQSTQSPLFQIGRSIESAR